MSDVEWERAAERGTARPWPRPLAAFPLRAEEGPAVGLGAVGEGCFEFRGI